MPYLLCTCLEMFSFVILLLLLKNICAVLCILRCSSPKAFQENTLFFSGREFDRSFSASLCRRKLVDHQIVIILLLKSGVVERIDNSSEDIFLPLCQSLVVSLYIYTRRRTSHQTRSVSLSDL